MLYDVGRHLEIVFLELRRAFRRLTQSPLVASLAVLSLAIGLGANTAILAVAQAVLLRPLPYSQPDRIVMIWKAPQARPSRLSGFRDQERLVRQISTAADVRNWRLQAITLDDLAAIESWQDAPAGQIDLVVKDFVERLRGARVTPNFFDALGVTPKLGRAFSDTDTPEVAVISYSLWSRAFNRDPNIIGSKIELTDGRDRDRKLFSIIGVLPENVQFTYPLGTEIWTAMAWQEIMVPTERDFALRFRVMATVRRGVTLTELKSELNRIQQDASFPSSATPGTAIQVNVESISEHALGNAQTPVLLLGAVTLIVTIATSLSVSTLLMSQIARRRNEFAIQQAIGASRSRLISQIVAEVGLLSAVGTAAAIAANVSLLPVVRSLLPATLARLDELYLDLSTVGWTAALATMMAGVIGLAPSWQAAMNDRNLSALGAQGGTHSRSSVRVKMCLVAAQSSLVYLLLAGAGLLLWSFLNLQRVDLGFTFDNVTAVSLRLMGSEFRSPQRRLQFQDELTARVRAIPGVSGVGLSSAIPFQGVDTVAVVRPSEVDAKLSVMANERHVDEGYFAVMGISLVAGRLIEPIDHNRSPAVAVLSKSLADSLFPNASPIGRTMHLRYPVEIVGVVADIRARRHEDAGNPAYYLAKRQMPSDRVCLVIRSDLSKAHLEPLVTAVIRNLDPKQPIEGVARVDEIVAASVADRRFYATATAALGLVTLLLAVLSLAGILFQMVRERRRELGIRLVLGASPTRLMAMVFVQGLLPVGLGTALGVILTLWAFRVAQHLLFGMQTVQVIVYSVASVTVIAIAMLACYPAARTAARTNIYDAVRNN